MPREPVDLAAEADDDVAKGAIVHVERATPRDEARIDLALFAVLRAEMAGVVDHRREQVVRRGDRVDVAGEVEVDVVGGDERGLAAAGAAALDAEDRAERRLAQAERDLLAEAAHAHREADRRRRLALARGRRVDRRHEDQPAPALGDAVERGEVDLRFAFAVGLEAVVGQAELAGDGGDRLRFQGQGHGRAPSATGGPRGGQLRTG